MADISLDDLIKKDRDQYKANKGNKVIFKDIKKFNNKKFPPRKFQDNQDRPQNPNHA